MDFPSREKWCELNGYPFQEYYDHPRYDEEEHGFYNYGVIPPELENYFNQKSNKMGNYRQNSGGGYNVGSYGYGKRNYAGSNGNSRNGGNQQNSKRSGVTYTRIKKGKHEGMMAVNAWRVSKRSGLMTASAFPVSDKEYTGDNGKVWLRYAVEIVSRDTGTTQTYWCLMDKASRKIFIKELGLVISPNGSGTTAKGRRVSGFFGKVFG